MNELVNMRAPIIVCTIMRLTRRGSIGLDDTRSVLRLLSNAPFFGRSAADPAMLTNALTLTFHTFLQIVGCRDQLPSMKPNPPMIGLG